MSLYPELDGLSLTELIERFHEPPPEGTSVYYEEVAVQIRKQGDDGLRFLLDQAGRVEDDEPRLPAVMLGLTFPRLDATWVERFLLAHLEDRRPLIVMDAMDGLRLQGVPAAHDRMVALARHRSPYVRGGVLRYMAEMFPDEAGPLLLAALKDRHCIVRESAVDALDESEVMDAAEAVEAIRPLLSDPHPHVREAAEWAVYHLRDGVPG